MRVDSQVICSLFIVTPDKGLFDIGVCDVDIASCDGIVRSVDCTIVCSEGDVFLCREGCSLASDDGIEVSICNIAISSCYC